MSGKELIKKMFVGNSSVFGKNEDYGTKNPFLEIISENNKNTKKQDNKKRQNKIIYIKSK